MHPMNFVSISAGVSVMSLLTLGVAHANDDCFAEAAATYGVTELTLRAIAIVESSSRPWAVNRNHYQRTGSIDIGLMQVNSRWTQAKPLKQLGYTTESLRDPCTNIKVGAWILANSLRTHKDYWEGVGAYNAACTVLKGDDCKRARYTYAWKVYRAMKTL